MHDQQTAALDDQKEEVDEKDSDQEEAGRGVTWKWETDRDNWEYDWDEDYKGASVPCRWLRAQKSYTPEGW